jgi:Transposase
MLFVGDDWAEDHHDVEIVDDDGQVLARRRLPEGPGGITRLHALIGEHLPEGWADWEPARAAAMVKVGIETDRGPWVAALVATGYEVFAINPMSVAWLQLGRSRDMTIRSTAARTGTTGIGPSSGYTALPALWLMCTWCLRGTRFPATQTRRPGCVCTCPSLSSSP